MLSKSTTFFEKYYQVVILLSIAVAVLAIIYFVGIPADETFKFKS